MSPCTALIRRPMRSMCWPSGTRKRRGIDRYARQKCPAPFGLQRQPPFWSARLMRRPPAGLVRGCSGMMPGKVFGASWRRRCVGETISYRTNHEAATGIGLHPVGFIRDYPLAHRPALSHPPRKREKEPERLMDNLGLSQVAVGKFYTSRQTFVSCGAVQRCRRKQKRQGNDPLPLRNCRPRSARGLAERQACLRRRARPKPSSPRPSSARVAGSGTRLTSVFSIIDRDSV